jgi:hypothetical protein
MAPPTHVGCATYFYFACGGDNGQTALGVAIVGGIGILPMIGRQADAWVDSRACTWNGQNRASLDHRQDADATAAATTIALLHFSDARSRIACACGAGREWNRDWE